MFESRILLEQAKGIVAERNGVGVDVAFELIRGYARNHNQLLRQTAQQLIEGAITNDALVEPTRSERP